MDFAENTLKRKRVWFSENMLRAIALVAAALNEPVATKKRKPGVRHASFLTDGGKAVRPQSVSKIEVKCLHPCSRLAIKIAVMRCEKNVWMLITQFVPV